ncbi:hypothetical protein OAP06_04635 [Gammaproteobacteria bacterium]|nr:hypothetical protein [Gammaproteobacteria bacterium]
MSDEKYYLEATKEFESGSLDEALWSKSLAVNQGDETKAKYSYINQRAKELSKEAVRKSFSNNLGNFKKLIKRMIRPFFILVVAALVIFGIIKTIDYIQTRAEEAAYQQQLEKQAAADAIAKAVREEKERIAAVERAEQERIAALERAEQERIAALERAEQERIAALERAEQERIAALERAEQERIAALERAEQERIAAVERAEQERIAALERAEQERIAALERAEQERIAALERAEYAEKVEKAYIGFNCKEYGSNGGVRKHFSFIMNHLLLTLDYVYDGERGGEHFPRLEEGGLYSAETFYELYMDKLGREWLASYYLYLDKTTLQIEKNKDYAITYKCVMTDHNEIRERVRKEQQEIRSGYKDFPN